MPSRVLETVLTGRNLLSPVLTKAAADVEGYDAKVAASQARASQSSAASAKVQETSAAKVTAANARTAESSSAASAKVVAANARSAESARAFADVSESSAARAGVAFGSLATKALPLAAAAVAVITGKMAADFQSNVVRLETTAGEAHKNIAMISQGLLDMAPAVGISASELAKGMYTVESAGFHGRDALLVEKAAAQGAAQEHADLAKVTDAVTTALHDYHLPASKAADVTSQLVTAVSHGKTTFDELTGSLHSVTPLASVLHVSLADVTGTLSAMTASGMSADQATQNMADTLRHLANPTNTMTAELAQLGITSSDLSDDLSTKGLAGTLQLVETAIVNHLDPATRRVLLPALNQSKIAAQDMTAMIAAMPPGLAKASQSLLDGTTSIKDYRTAAKDMGGQQGAMALQFLSLMQSADGFNQVLKAGGPQAQAVAAAMAKSFGTSSALNVALMTTGENAAATNAAISDINKTAADGKGDIKGWAEVQATAAQQAKEAAAGVGKLAIEFGNHLLPAATGALGYINRDVIPGLEHLGSGVGGAVHWFLQLPAPVRDAVGALVALKVITSTDMFAGFKASGRVLAVGFANDMRNMVASARAGAGQMTAAFAEAKAAQQALVAERFGINTSQVSRATGDIRGLGAAAGVAAKGGLSALKSGIGGVVNLLGGPWIVGIGAAVAGIAALVAAMHRHDEEIRKDTEDVKKWSEAVALGGGGTSAISAQKHLDDLKQKIAGVTEKINEYNAAAQGGYARGGVGNLITLQKELQGELDRGTKAWKDQLAGMTPVQTAQARLTVAQQDLNDALKHNPPTSQAVVVAESNLAAAQGAVAGETERANRAAQTQIQQQQDQANKARGLVDAQRQAQEASLALTQQVTDYNKQAADGSLKGDALTQATLGIVDAAEQAANAAGDAAAKQAAQNHATDTGAASQAAFMKSLQDAASTMTGPAKKALEDYIAQLGGQQSQAQLTAGAINQLGVTVTGLPDSHLITINAPTADQEQKLHQLGYDTVHLPNGQVIVTADTNPAISEIQDLLAYARQQSIQYRSDLPDLVPNVSGGGRMGHAATGGEIHGPGTGTSDTAGLWALSDGEFVVNAKATAQHLELLHAINSGAVGRMAGGGYVGPSTVNIPVSIDEAQAKGVIGQVYKSAAAAAMSAFAGYSGGGNPYYRQLGQQIAAGLGFGGQFSAIDYIFSHESGWNPQAQNPTSTAFGIPQFLNGTWGAYGGKTTDPGRQIYDGIEYMRDRYGSPNAAAAFWAAHHWYRDGTNYVPADQLAVLHKGEAVVPAALNQGTPYQPAPSMPGYSGPFSGAHFGPTGPIQVNAQVRVFVGDREITDIVRVEATAVVDHELGALHDTVHYATGH